ncbi:hypothetical protein [Ectobacillus sp. sgz5001026]|uniref:hypothetical protein n=1 Tax=Ectobacillus sp. sgz5001026 TaxID=3242473 RepID=UPI0036D324EF
MSTFKYTINLGKKAAQPHFFCKKIVWPVYAWKAILPSIFTEELDILQELVLSLAKINKLKDHTIIYQLGMSKELIKTVKESCVQQGYLGSDGYLTKSGEQLLTNSLNVEQGMLMNYEQIYIFRDALTGDIIPNFKVSELPVEENLQYDYVFEGHSNYRYQKPTFFDIGQALKIRKQINRIADTLQKDYANEVIEADQCSFLDEMDLLIKEVDWQLIDDNGEIEIKSLKDKEESQAETNMSENNTTIKIISNKPEILYLEANLYVDPDLPEKVAITSPFGENEDDWFTKHMLMHAQKNDRLQENIEFFMQEAQEELIDKYPFNNNLDIELFKKYPFIANYEAWKALRSQIEATTRSYNRLIEYHEDYDTFYMRAQRTLEGVLKYCIEKIPNKWDVIKPITRYSFKDTLKRIAENLRIDIPSNLYSADFYNRLRSVANNRGISSKDRALFLAFDAYYNEHETPSLQLLKSIPDFYKRINIITNVRNKTAHFTEAEVVKSQNFVDIKYELDFLLDSLIAHYLK